MQASVVAELRAELGQRSENAHVVCLESDRGQRNNLVKLSDSIETTFDWFCGVSRR